MRSKEDILDYNNETFPNEMGMPLATVIHAAALKAMEEYANIKSKEMAIGFAKWMVDGSYDKVAGDWDGVVSFQEPPEQLYQQYLNTLP